MKNKGFADRSHPDGENGNNHSRRNGKTMSNENNIANGNGGGNTNGNGDHGGRRNDKRRYYHKYHKKNSGRDRENKPEQIEEPVLEEEAVLEEDGNDEEIISEQEDELYTDDLVDEGGADEVTEPKKPFYDVVGVRFRDGGKIYYFDPNDIDCDQNTHVIVETARGLEFATVTMPKRTVKGSEVVLPLRKLVRIATENDERRHEDNLEKETEAYNLCLSKIEAHRLEMKLVDVEYAFDNSKLLFYFTSEGRVDFRDLVKDLASVFRTRIELRQIGIRDEAKLMGGLGVCGRPFCCKAFLPDFGQVSIKMAKEQNLSLNSAKISGACGRLMCCLRYEYDTYVAESSITPKVDAIVSTPDGDGVVTESLPLKGIVKVALDKDPTVIRVYHRDDLTIKGHQKGKHKTVGKNAEKQKSDDKAPQNKKNPEKTDKN